MTQTTPTTPISSDALILSRLAELGNDVRKLTDKIETMWRDNLETSHETKSMARRAHDRIDALQTSHEKHADMLDEQAKLIERMRPWVMAAAWGVMLVATVVTPALGWFVWSLLTGKIQVVTP